MSPAPHRRALLLGAGRGAVRLGLAGVTLAAAVEMLRRGAAPRDAETAGPGILRPPGALEERDFLATCLRCQLCAEACDTGCIELLGPTEGRHAGTPHITPARVACNLCLACTRACPSGALAELSDPTAVRMGVAVVESMDQLVRDVLADIHRLGDTLNRAAEIGGAMSALPEQARRPLQRDRGIRNSAGECAAVDGDSHRARKGVFRAQRSRSRSE